MQSTSSVMSLQCLSAWSPIRTPERKGETAAARIVFSAFRRGVLFGLQREEFQAQARAKSSVPFGVESYSDDRATVETLCTLMVFSAFRRGVLFGLVDVARLFN